MTVVDPSVGDGEAALPIIDLSPFLPSAKPEDLLRKASVAHEVRKACKDVGFMYVTGHGIPEEKLLQMRQLTKAFFDLPEQEKEKIHFSKSDFARGYQRLAQNVTKYKRDYHEGIDFYKEVNSNDTLVKMGKKTLTGKNQYPENPPEFKHTFLDYIEAMSGVGKAIMHAVATGLELEETYFDKFMDNAFWCARAIGYPPLTAAKDGEVGVSCGEHTDYGNCTILNTDETPNALQVLRKDGEWVCANPISGCLVVNIGDMLSVWTNGLYKATLHRVIHKSNSYRVSIPFFYEPCFDTVVEPIPSIVAQTGGVPLYEPTLYGMHLLKKVSNNFDEGVGEEKEGL